MLKIADTKVAMDDFIKAFEKVIVIFNTMKSDNEQERDEIRNTLQTTLKRLQAKSDSLKDGVNGKDGRDGKDGVQGPKGDDGKDGIDGKDGKDADIKELSPDEIRDSLELLSGEERLDASAIKNLPKVVQQHVTANGAGPLWGLTDVDVAGVSSGQSIRWDGVRWTPFTPAGGANTPVYEEAPTDTGNHLAFTLAHTPVASTLRLYRGGARQQLNTDYTLSGSTITLVNIFVTGESLLCDYEY